MARNKHSPEQIVALPPYFGPASRPVISAVLGLTNCEAGSSFRSCRVPLRSDGLSPVFTR